MRPTSRMIGPSNLLRCSKYLSTAKFTAANAVSQSISAMEIRNTGPPFAADDTGRKDNRAKHVVPGARSALVPDSPRPAARRHKANKPPRLSNARERIALIWHAL